MSSCSWVRSFTHEPERCPADLVDFVVGSELTANGLHHPVADAASATVTVDVADLGKFVLDGAPKTGLLANFTERALERRLASSSPAFGQRPVLSVRSVDHEHLVAMPARGTQYDPTC